MMSAYIVGKVDIDLLVQLALLGPAGARGWTPIVSDPDAFGRDLWALNEEVAGFEDDEPLPMYAYEPLPIGVTVVEGLVAVAHYGYQTLEEHVLDRPVARQVEVLRTRLEQALLQDPPGWAEAPWGWSAADLSQRAGRAAPGQDVPLEDPVAAAALRRLRDGGLDLELSPGMEVPGAARLHDPRAVLGTWFARPHRGVSGMLGLTTWVCTSADAARAVWLHARERSEREAWQGGEREVLRTGLLVHEATCHRDLQIGPLFDAMVARLVTDGVDEHWRSVSPPGGAVAVGRVIPGVPVSLRPGSSVRGEVAQSARTRQGRASLVQDIIDPAATALVQDLAGSETVLLVHGLARLDVVSGTWTEVVSPYGLAARLRLDVSGQDRGQATLVVLDPLPLPVTEVVLMGLDGREVPVRSFPQDV